MQVPSAFAAALAIDPYKRFALHACDEVVARDVVAVPPSGLDALRADEQLKRPVVVRHGLDLGKRPGAIEQPERSLAEIELQLLCSEIGDHAGVFRAMLGPASDATHCFGAEPSAQPL